MAPAAAHAGSKMIVVGGGTRPDEANSKFVEWAGGQSANLLVISWSAPDPKDYFDCLHDDFKAYSPKQIIHGVGRADVETQRDDLLNQIKHATGIFFTGGDQVPAMDIIDADLKKHGATNSILGLLHDRYKAGVVFGGTSAGTALMSSPMLTGTGDETILDGRQIGTRDGLGLIGDVVFDQHFLARKRMLRLMGVMQLNTDKVGFGVDECTAMLIEDSRYAEIVGCSHVMAVRTATDGKFDVDMLAAGTHYDIVKRAKM